MTKEDYFHYDAATSPHAIFPLGGIGAGGIGIGADGRLQDWEIYNRPSKGSVNGFSHFAVRAERAGEVLDTRILNGPFNGNRSGVLHGADFNTFGFGPRRQELTGLPHFAHSSITGPYPVADLSFSDERFPGAVSMRAMSPFIPMDDRSSSMPVAQFEIEIANTGQDDLDYTFFGCIGFEFENARVSTSTDRGLVLTGATVCEPSSTKYAEISLATDHPDTSHQRHLFRGAWFDTMEVYWADISRGGRLRDRFYGETDEFVPLNKGPHVEHSIAAAHLKVPAGQSKTVRFAIGWYVPNVKKTWVSHFALLNENPSVDQVWKNYYATQWKSASHVLEEVFDRWDELAQQTQSFRDSLAASTLPLPVLDAVSANLSIAKSPTALRLEDGTFYGWEGCHPTAGCCEGSCTHVWNYQQALPFLFPALERSMREADYFENQIPETGGMAFRMALPKGVGISTDRPCADGQFGNVLKAYRDWKLCGDTDWLRKIWPNVTAAIDYAWAEGNYDRWDPDQTGVLTGRQHHTLDMELFGANSWLTGFYLGALLAGAEMADALGEQTRAERYRDIFSRGKKWVTDNLFNGHYFVQQVSLNDKSQLDQFNVLGGSISYLSGNIYEQYWSDEHGELKYQIADGCEIDQVVAQWHAHLYGLGEIFDPSQFASAVKSIYEHNFKPRLGDVPNPCRVFGMEEESGTLMCAWPDGSSRPAIPVPYAQETMHGFEYAAGCQLMMIGEVDKGIDVFAGVRDRYRGHNRNPWNEIECGSNYARSMSSYAALITLSGLQFDGVKGELSFDPTVHRNGEFQSFWSNGNAWGTVSIGGGKAELTVLAGTLSIAKLGLCGQSYGLSELIHLDGANAKAGRAEFSAGSTLAFANPDLRLTDGHAV